MRRMRRPYREQGFHRPILSGARLSSHNSNTNANEPILETTDGTSTDLMGEGTTNELGPIFDFVGSTADRVPVDINQEDVKVGRILRSIREVISCCACYSSETLMKECTNGHLICQNCFLTLRQDERPQCPTCRANLYSDSRRALIAQKVLAELPDICGECNAQMLHKALSNHRLNSCPKRRVACGLSALGCEWTGFADTYEEHFHSCDLKKKLTEQPLGGNIEWLINRFKKREQTMRETFHCFSNVLRHLESHELQTVTVTLANISTNDSIIHYRSDHFHVNQSRWTAEIDMTLPDEHPITEQLLTMDESTNQTLDSSITESAHPTDHSETIGSHYAESRELLQPLNVHVMRKRRWHQGPSVRHHPYQIPTSTVPATNPIQTAARLAVPGTQDSATAVTTTPTSHASDMSDLGQITYRMLKENSPGIGRRAYSFILLQIRVPDTGIQIYARPQLQSYRYSSRGDHSTTFTVHPIRWRYLTSLKELMRYRIIQAEFVVARKLVDDHVDS